MLEVHYKDYVFTESEIERNANVYRIISLLSDSLEYDVFNFTVKSSAIGEQRLWTVWHEYITTASDEIFVINDGDLAEFDYGDPVEIYEDGQRRAVFYVTDISTEDMSDDGDEFFRVQCVSIIGILARMEHAGGIYEGETAGNIIADIMRGLPYTIDPDVAAVQLNGWLPYTKDARSNLQQVLFATGASVKRNANGEMHIEWNQPEVAIDIPKDRTERTPLVKRPDFATKITLTEHAYYNSQNAVEEELFDNTAEASSAQRKLIFSKPYVSYRGVGLTVDTANSGANYVTVSGIGTLYGTPYIHVEREVVRNITGDGKPLEISFTDATLVSTLNVAGIADRLENYYSTAMVRKAVFHVEHEKPGDLVTFYDRRGQQHTGYIRSLDEYKTSFWRGTAEIVTDWVPTTPGNDYDSYIYVTRDDLVNGTWSSGALAGKRARIVLFSGAEGGEGGHAGGTPGIMEGGGGKTMYLGNPQNIYKTYIGKEGGIQYGGLGGAGGRGGASATRILNIDIQSLAASYNVVFGEGGDGGAGGTATWASLRQESAVVTEPELGLAGAASTWGTYSTDDGAAFRGTYINLITGEIVAQVGENGMAGADGGNGGVSLAFKDATNEEEWSYAIIGKGENGKPVRGYSGGIGAEGVNGTQFAGGGGYTLPSGKYFLASGGGGGGGGAAAGANGGNGTVSFPYYLTSGHTAMYGCNYTYTDLGPDDEPNIRYRTFYGAVGGDGADATAIPAQPLYRGGTGGAGGGGAGGGGQSIGVLEYDNNYRYVTRLGQNRSGLGGNGGQGGKGSNGFAIVYYKA